MRTLLLVLVIIQICCAACSSPSRVQLVLPGIWEVRDDNGVWLGMANGITHMSTAEYTAKKILDTSRISKAEWSAAKYAVLSVYFMVRDYSWHDLPAANGLDESYQIIVNGHVYEYPTAEGAPVFVEPGIGGIDWFDFRIPKDQLVHGPNEVLIRKSPGSKGDDYLYLGIDSSVAPGNSYVTFDGTNWTKESLTVPGGKGEYMVRMSMLRDSTKFRSTWTSTSKAKFFEYVGSKNSKHAPAGLKITSAEGARVEWNSASLDNLEPVEIEVVADSNVKLQWLDSNNQLLPGTSAVAGSKISLPVHRAIQPSGVLISTDAAETLVSKVIISAGKTIHPRIAPINMAPPVKAVKVPKPAKPSCKISSDSITMSCGHVKAVFAIGRFLKLTSLYNAISGTEMLRYPGAAKLFLVELGGKRYSGSSDFILRSVKSTANGFTATLNLPEHSINCDLTAQATDQGLRFGLQLNNVGKKQKDFKLAFPYLGGLSVSGDTKKDYYFFPWGGGIIADTPALLRRAYGDHEALYQVMDIFSPSLGTGLAIRAEDKQGWHKVLALRKHVPNVGDMVQDSLTMLVKPEYQWIPCSLEVENGTAFAYEYLRRTRKPGKSFTPSSVMLTVHPGDWHWALKEYSDWAHRAWKFRPYPSRLKSVHNMVAAGWATAYLFVNGKYRTDIISPKTDCIELMSWWDWSPLGPFNTPIDQLSADILKGWDGYFVDDPVTGIKMWNNQPGDYLGYNERFGGLPAFREAIQTYKSMGALTTLYTDPFRMDFASKIGREHGEEWGVVDNQDKLSLAYEVYNPCHDLADVRDWVAKTMGRVMRETGADGIRLDEYGHRGWACYNPKHKHTYAESGITQWQKAVAETTRMVHEQMDMVRPDLVLTTEHPGYDYLMQYLEGCITYDLSGQRSPLRPLECNLQRFYFPECKAYELDHTGADPNSIKRFWNAVECFGSIFPDNMYAIVKENEDVYQSRDSYPLLPTLKAYLYCNRFRGAGKTIYHLFNATGSTFDGPALQLSKDLVDFRVVELLSNKELSVDSGKVSVYLDRGAIASIAVVPKTLTVTKSSDSAQIKIYQPNPSMKLVFCDSHSTSILTLPVSQSEQRVDIARIKGAVCVKLLKNGQLVDICGL